MNNKCCASLRKCNEDKVSSKQLVNTSNGLNNVNGNIDLIDKVVLQCNNCKTERKSSSLANMKAINCHRNCYTKNPRELDDVQVMKLGLCGWNVYVNTYLIDNYKQVEIMSNRLDQLCGIEWFVKEYRLEKGTNSNFLSLKKLQSIKGLGPLKEFMNCVIKQKISYDAFLEKLVRYKVLVALGLNDMFCDYLEIVSAVMKKLMEISILGLREWRAQGKNDSFSTTCIYNSIPNFVCANEQNKDILLDIQKNKYKYCAFLRSIKKYSSIEQSILKYTIDPRKLGKVYTIDAVVNKFIVQYREMNVVDLEHFCNSSSSLNIYCYDEYEETCGLISDNFVRQYKTMKWSDFKEEFIDTVDKYNLKSLNSSVMRHLLSTGLRRNIKFAYFTRNKCCVYDSLMPEIRRINKSNQPLCEQCKRACNIAFIEMQRRMKNPTFPIYKNKIFLERLLNGDYTQKDIIKLIKLTRNRSVDVNEVGSKWRIAQLFKYNSVATSGYLKRLLMTYLDDWVVQSKKDKFVSEGVMSSISNVCNNTKDTFNTFNQALWDIPSIVTTIRDMLPSIQNNFSVFDEILNNLQSSGKAISDSSWGIAIASTLCKIISCVDVMSALQEINILYNLLKDRISIPFSEIVMGRNSDIFDNVNDEMVAEGLQDMLPQSLPTIFFTVLTTAALGHMPFAKDIKIFITKYVTTPKNFGFEAIWNLFRKDDGNSRIVEFFQDLLNLCGFDFQTWNTLLTDFKGLAEILNLLRSVTTNEEEFKAFAMKEGTNVMVEEWLIKINAFQYKMNTLLPQMIQGRHSQIMTMSQNVNILRRELMEFVKRIKNIQAQGTVQQQALWIDFMGAPGCGKTYTLINVIFPALKFSNDLTDLYVRNDTKHFDGHTVENCFLFDDYNQMSDDKAKEIFDLCSGFPFIPAKADVDQKGQTIIPRIIFSTSNKPQIIKSRVASNEAFERRRTHLVQVRLCPSYCSIHKDDMEYVSCSPAICGIVATSDKLEYSFIPSFTVARRHFPTQDRVWLNLENFMATLNQVVKDHTELSQKVDDNKPSIEQITGVATAIPDFTKYMVDFTEPSICVETQTQFSDNKGQPIVMNVNVDNIEPIMFLPPSFEVVNYNMNGFQTDLCSEFLNYIKNNKPLVLCLQEVNKAMYNSLLLIPGYKLYAMGHDYKLVTMVNHSLQSLQTKSDGERTMSVLVDNVRILNVHLKRNDSVNVDDCKTVDCYGNFYHTITCGDFNEHMYGLNWLNKLNTFNDKCIDNIHVSYGGQDSGVITLESDHKLVCTVINRPPTDMVEQGLRDDVFTLKEYIGDTMYNLLDGVDAISIKNLIMLLLQYQKQGSGMLSYLWEDCLIKNVQEVQGDMLNVLNISDDSLLRDPVVINAIFAMTELWCYWYNRKQFTEEFNISTVTFLLLRLQAAMMHVTQSEGLLSRITRHAMYNGTNWNNFTGNPLLYSLHLFKIFAWQDYSFVPKVCSAGKVMLTNVVNNMSATKAHITETGMYFSSHFDFISKGWNNFSTWTNEELIRVMELTKETKLMKTLRQVKQYSFVGLSSIVNKISTYIKDFKNYVLEKMYEHPLVSGGIFSALLLSLGYLFRKRNAQVSNAQILSYDEMYNISRLKEDVLTPNFEDKLEMSVGKVGVEEMYGFDVDEVEVQKSIKLKKKVQGARDNILHSQTIPAVSKNCVVVKVGGMKMSGIFIGGHILLVPKHLTHELKVMKMTIQGDQEAIEVQVDFGDNNVVMRASHSDVMAIHLKCNRLQAFRDIRSHFITADIAKNINKSNVVLYGRKVENPRVFIEQNSKSERAVDMQYSDHDGKRCISSLGLKYNISTQAGDCGKLLFVENNELNSKLYGFHVCGNGKSAGYAMALTRELVEVIFNSFEKISSRPNKLVNGFLVEGDLTANFNEAKVLPGNILESVGNFSYLGIMPNTKVPFRPSKTSLRKTELYDKVEISVKGPAVLYPVKRDGILKHPMKASLDKYGIPLKSFDLKTIKRIENKLVEDHKSKDKLEIYTEEECIGGTFDGLGKLNNKSSCGYPYVLDKIKKEDIFDYDLNRIKDETFRKNMLETEKDLHNGLHSSQIWMDCLKDEKRSLIKIEEVKTRTFTIPSVVTSYITRKYFGTLVDHLTNLRIKTPYTVGINVEGPEWSELFMKHNTHSAYIIAGDYSGYDGITPPEFVSSFANYANAIYDDGNDVLRHQLCSELTHTIQLCENLLYMTHQGIPSGSPLTVQINSYANMMFMMYAYLELGEGKVNLETWDKHVRLTTYGDDNLLSIDPEIIDWFNFVTISQCFASYGVKYTPETKDDNVLPYRSIYDVSFLKRKFVRHCDYDIKILAPIATESIYELLNWYHKGMSMEEALEINLDDVFRKSHAYGKQFHDNLLKRVNVALEEVGYEPVRSSWYEKDILWLTQFDR